MGVDVRFLFFLFFFFYLMSQSLISALCVHRPDNYDLYLRDIFKQRLEAEQGKTSPLADKTFFQLTLRERVDLLQQLCDFRLDAEDVFDLLKVCELICFVWLCSFYWPSRHVFDLQRVNKNTCLIN